MKSRENIEIFSPQGHRGPEGLTSAAPAGLVPHRLTGRVSASQIFPHAKSDFVFKQTKCVVLGKFFPYRVLAEFGPAMV